MRHTINTHHNRLLGGSFIAFFSCVSSHRYCNCLRTLKEGLPDVDAAYRCRLFWVLPSNCLCDET
ncbi:hypothetical protein DMP58_26635, partial [Klebsiella pneumoniae]